MAARALQEPARLSSAGFILISRQITQGETYMKKKTQIEGVIDSLDGLLKASPGPFFFTRVQAKLQKEETGTWASLATFLTKPSVALTTLGLIFLLNGAAFLYQKEVATNAADQNEQVLTEDYNTTLAANSYYDDNTDAH
jgi:hypothetical protein